MKERVCVIEGGGRGTALVDGYAKSPHVGEIIAIPGNDPMHWVTEKKVVTHPELKTTDIKKIVEICKNEKVSLVDVAQDNAVAAGLTDALNESGIRTVGPTARAGKIEWSKSFSRKIGEKVGLLQAEYMEFESEEEGIKFLEQQEEKEWFIKADGLTEGKGALPAKSNKEAIERVREIKKFGNSSQKYLIEEWLTGDNGEEGEEFSTFYISDSETTKYLGSAQDHKRALNFDEGENTGGMGASTPPLGLTPYLEKKITNISKKVINELSIQGRPYKGVLFGGIMALNKNNTKEPYIIEWNSRWGDPEAQVLIPGMETDLFELGMAVADKKLKDLEIVRDNKSRVAVAGASRGYPGNYDLVKGRQIFGLNEASKVGGVKIYGAGIKVEDNKHYASGGRLFYIVGEGKNVIEARQKAYQAMSLVHVDGNNLHYRSDIGWRDVQRLRI